MLKMESHSCSHNGTCSLVWTNDTFLFDGLHNRVILPWWFGSSWVVQTGLGRTCQPPTFRYLSGHKKAMLLKVQSDGKRLSCFFSTFVSRSNSSRSVFTWKWAPLAFRQFFALFLRPIKSHQKHHIVSRKPWSWKDLERIDLVVNRFVWLARTSSQPEMQVACEDV